MSSDAEDRLARMKLLVKALADPKLGSNCATAMREECAQLAAAIAALGKSEHPQE